MTDETIPGTAGIAQTEAIAGAMAGASITDDEHPLMRSFRMNFGLLQEDLRPLPSDWPAKDSVIVLPVDGGADKA
jgi:hypothetical protein